MHASSILVVDDEVPFLAAIKRALAARGAIVETARDLASARRSLGRKRFDLVMVDINLGTERGEQLIGELRRSDDPAVVAITGGPEELACMTMHKPLSPGQIAMLADGDLSEVAMNNLLRILSEARQISQDLSRSLSKHT